MTAACAAQSLQTCDPMIDRRPQQRHRLPDTDPAVWGHDLRQRQGCRAATAGPARAQRAAARQAYGIVWKRSSKLERAMGIEPTTSSLGSLRSTAELRPHRADNARWRGHRQDASARCGKNRRSHQSPEQANWCGGMRRDEQALRNRARFQLRRATASRASAVIASQSLASTAAFGATHEPPTQTTFGRAR
jgi:hypothetical protein